MEEGMKISTKGKTDMERSQARFIEAFMELATKDELRLFMEMPDGPRRDAFVKELAGRAASYARDKTNDAIDRALDAIGAHFWIDGYCDASEEATAAHILRDFEAALRPALLDAGMSAIEIPAIVAGLSAGMQDDRRRKDIREVQP
jgi:hypothetical protein